jgi:hypothetical protein
LAVFWNCILSSGVLRALKGPPRSAETATPSHHPEGDQTGRSRVLCQRHDTAKITPQTLRSRNLSKVRLPRIPQDLNGVSPMNAVTIPRSLDALRRRRPCRAPLARPLYFRCHSRRVSFLLFQSGSFGIWPGNSPDSSPYEWTFGTFRHKPLGKIVYTFSGSDPARRQTMKRP